MHPAASAWFAEASSRASDWPPERLRAAKGGRTVSVVLPARDEEATVGHVVDVLARSVLADGLVDEVLVVDSGSCDATVGRAASAGARVVRSRDVLAARGDRPGKGEALWKGLAASSGDLVVHLDADLTDPRPEMVSGLLGPLLLRPGTAFVKGSSTRPLAGVSATGGGRVTELLARPLLAAWWPQLTGVVQPLGGEYAARRDLLETLPYAAGYGVDLGLLIDAEAAAGLHALAQVDIGTRTHSHAGTAALGRMAAEVLAAARGRLPGPPGRTRAGPQGAALVQFEPDATAPGGFRALAADAPEPDRPPLVRRLALSG